MALFMPRPTTQGEATPGNDFHPITSIRPDVFTFVSIEIRTRDTAVFSTPLQLGPEHADKVIHMHQNLTFELTDRGETPLSPPRDQATTQAVLIVNVMSTESIVYIMTVDFRPYDTL